MKILFLSKLSGNPWAGPTYSVPKQIFAQSKIDDVFWMNLNRNKRKNWIDTGVFHNNENFFVSKLNDFPSPFDNPDVVVVEGFYDYFFDSIIRDVIRKKIPYVLVPRGELTTGAQNQKKIKKFLGNFFWFNHMAKKATLIHYLSEVERVQSKKFGMSNIVVPNGIDVPEYPPKKFHDEVINACFIGRLDLYHKGIDVLLDAVDYARDDLLKMKFVLHLYGPEWNGSSKKIAEIIKTKGLEKIVVLEKPVYDEEKKGVLNDADLFIMTSRFEGLPMGLLEALSMGLPCLVTPGTNLMEKVLECNAGWGCELLASKISMELRRAVMEKKLWPTKSKNANILARQFSWDVIAERSQRAYKMLMEKKL